MADSATAMVAMARAGRVARSWRGEEVTGRRVAEENAPSRADPVRQGPTGVDSVHAAGYHLGILNRDLDVCLRTHDDNDVNSSLDLKLVNVDLGPYGSGLHAIEIRNGVIDKVEPLAERVRSTAIGVTDLMGSTVLPGIDDSHLHGFYFGRALISVDLQTAETLDQLKAILRTACADESGWIRGNGWDAGRIQGTGPGGTVCAADIDEVTPDVPVFLTDMTGHLGVGNTIVMRLAGISERTLDPVGGSFVRDEHGVPTGLILEGAVRLINEIAPRLSPKAERAAILTAQENLLSRGITAFTDPGLGPGAVSLMEGSGYLSAVLAYRDLAESGELSIRVNLMLLFGGLGGTTAADVRSGLANFGPPIAMQPFGRLGISQLKIFADGVPRSKTAWVTEPYDDCTCGHLQVAGNTDTERVAELTRMVADSAGSGWQIGAHSIGDRTVSAYLDAVAATPSHQGLRHYVIHGDLVRHDELVRMAELGVTMNSNPSIRWAVAAGAAAILGRERSLGRQPLAAAWRAGVNVAISSDAPVTAPDRRVIVAAAMTRSLKSDPDYFDDQKLTGSQAIDALTTNGAWQSHSETWRGKIAPGYAADLVVMDQTLKFEEPWSIPEAGVRATVIGGNVEFGEI